MTKTNNQYLKEIAENFVGEIDGKHMDNYYLKRIAVEGYHCSYTQNECNGRYYKDIAEAVNETTYDDHRFRNFYLDKWAEGLTHQTIEPLSDNQLLAIISENINPPTPTQELASIDVALTDGKQILSYADVGSNTEFAEVTFTCRDASNNVIPNLQMTLDIDDDSSTVRTDANGQYVVTYTSQGKGDIIIALSKEVSGELISQTYTVQDCFGYAPNEQYKTGYNAHFKILGDCNFPNNVDWELTADLKTSKGFIIVSPFSNGEQTSITQLDKYCGIGQNTVNNLLSALGFTNDIDNQIWITNGTYGSNYRSVKITKVNNTYSFYFDDVLHTTTTSQGFTAYTPLYPYLRINNSGNAYVKNLKIKQVHSIDVSADNPVLSYADGDTATLTATVSPVVQGKTVKIYKDDTLVATETTDSQGQVSYEYTSQGVGDVEFEFKCGLLTKTFAIEDIFKYAPTEISKTSSSSSTAKIFPYNFALDSEHFEMEFDIKYPSPTWAVGLSPSTNSNFQYNIGLGINGDSPYYWRTWKPTSSTSNTGTDSNVISSTNTYVTAKFIYNNGDCSIYVNDSLIVNYTGLSSLYQGITKTVGLQSWGTGTFYLKNLKVRTL